jgi:hypothetical protein
VLFKKGRMLGSSIRWAAFGPVFDWACGLSLSGPISSCCIVTICTEVTRMAGYRLSFVSTDIPVHLLVHATCSVSPPRFPYCSSIPCSSSSNSFPCCYFSFPTTLLLTNSARIVNTKTRTDDGLNKRKKAWRRSENPLPLSLLSCHTIAY